MKKSILFAVIGSMLFANVMTSCKEKSPYEGYALAENGLNYRFYVQNEGEKPEVGDILTVAYSCTLNDTVVLIPVIQDLLPLQEEILPGGFFDGLSMMHKGDSASFIVEIDSIVKLIFGGLEFDPTDVMRFDARLDDFIPESEYIKGFVENAQQQASLRAENLKAMYPEETAMAARKLQEYFDANGIVAEPTESGLVYVMTSEGNGEKPVAGKVAKVHYTGRLLDGTVFDSSVERGMPFEFPLGVGRVIPGWDEGIQLMSVGEKGVLYIPYYLAYGNADNMEEIPPFSNLIFEVELLESK